MIIPEKEIDKAVKESLAGLLPDLKNIVFSVRNEFVEHVNNDFQKAYDHVMDDLQDQIRDLGNQLTIKVDSAVKNTLTNELDKLRKPIIVDGVTLGEISLIDDTHVKLPQAVKLILIFKQLMLVGPTGSGKTTMAKQLAEAIGLKFAKYSCNVESSKVDLIGYQKADGTYLNTTFLDFYENGGLYLVDEFDAMNASIALFFNGVLDRSSEILVPLREENPIAKKHSDFHIIFSGNTWGKGGDYYGRDLQDNALLDRLKMSRLEIGYDEKLERAIAGKSYDWFMTIRKHMEDEGVQSEFSTRTISDILMLQKSGFGLREIMESLTADWEETERNTIISKFC